MNMVTYLIHIKVRSLEILPYPLPQPHTLATLHSNKAIYVDEAAYPYTLI